MSDTKVVSATLQLKLKADSGYTSDESHRINADQWGDVLRVATGTLSSAERDQLKAMSVEHILVGVVPGHDGMGQEVYAKSVDDVIALLSKLSGEVDELEIQRDQLKQQVEGWKEAIKAGCETGGIPEGTALVAVPALLATQRDQALAELEKALDSLEYVEQHLPGLAGYGVRQERIASGRAAMAAVRGEFGQVAGRAPRKLGVTFIIPPGMSADELKASIKRMDGGVVRTNAGAAHGPDITMPDGAGLDVAAVKGGPIPSAPEGDTCPFCRGKSNHIDDCDNCSGTGVEPEGGAE